jgi:hypothetical protein
MTAVGLGGWGLFHDGFLRCRILYQPAPVFPISSEALQENFTDIVELGRGDITVNGKRYTHVASKAYNNARKRHDLLEQYNRCFAYEMVDATMARAYMVEVLFVLNEGMPASFKEEARKNLETILRSIEFPFTEPLRALPDD